LRTRFSSGRPADHLLELLVVLLERAQALGVRVGHHAQLLLPAVEGRGGDVELPADLGLAPAGLVLAARILASFVWRFLLI